MGDGMTLLVVNEVHAVRGDGVPVGVFRAATNVLRAARAPSHAQCVERLLRGCLSIANLVCAEIRA